MTWNPSRSDDHVEALPFSWVAAHSPPGRFERPEFHVLALYTKGRTRHEVDFVSHPCRSGTLVHVGPGQVHRLSLATDVGGQALIFAPTMLPPNPPGRIWRAGFFEDLQWPTSFALDDDACRAAARSFAGISAVAARETASAMRSEHLSYALAATMLELAARMGLSPRGRVPPREESKLVRDFHDAVERSFRMTRSVTEYAQALSCAPRTLDRLARRSFGSSAKAYIDARVVLEAKRLLVHTSDTVAQIADTLGFSEATNFGKFFESRTGSSPGQFRRACVGGESTEARRRRARARS